jgi:predicted phage-related endonuclease
MEIMLKIDLTEFLHTRGDDMGFCGADEKFSTKDMSKEEWLSKRHYIGASSVASVLGLGNPRYSSIVKLWGGLVNGHEEFSSVPATIGTNLETKVLKIAGKYMGKKVFRKEAVLAHPDHDFLCCNLDGYVKEGGWIIPVEAKCATRDEMITWMDHPNLDWNALSAALRSGGKWPESTTIEGYWVQVQAQLNVCRDAPHAYLVGCVGAYPCLVAAVVPDAHKHLVLDRDYYIIKIERDEDFCTMLTETCVAFWQKHVLTKKCPQENVKECDLYHLKRQLRSNGSTTRKDDLYDLANQYMSMKEDVKLSQEGLKELEIKLRLGIDESEIVECGTDIRITAKEDKRGNRLLRIKRIEPKQVTATT